MYTTEKNIQIVISLLKSYGIHRVIVSPGTANVSFVGSIQNDDFFTVYSCIDERSAAYMACGMSAETGEPVVISCTGATASRNYMSALTEAFYRKLPVLAITSHEGFDLIGRLIPQQIDRRESPADIAVKKVIIPFIGNERDKIYCEDEINKALIALTRNGGGPVVMNVFTHNCNDFSAQELPTSRKITYYNYNSEFPEIYNGNTAIFIGAHKEFSREETLVIEKFCAQFNAVIFKDHTSGYHGKYSVMPALIFGQEVVAKELKDIDLLLHIGEVSGDYKGMQIAPKHVWRISEDGEPRNLFNTLEAVFQLEERTFFEHYLNNDADTKDSLYNLYHAEYQRIIGLLPEIPYSNIWVAQQLSKAMPRNSSLHLGILNSLRSWNFFELPNDIQSTCNVGGFGIDGILSTFVGASLANPDKNYYCVVGDLAFFYDMGILGNRHIGKNLRIILINNGCGTEFKNYSHMSHVLGVENIAPFIAAEGHYKCSEGTVAEAYAKALGFKYLCAISKTDFSSAIQEMLKEEEHSVIIEVCVNSQDESDALYKTLHITGEIAPASNNTIKEKIKTVLGDKVMNNIRNLRVKK